MAKNSTGILSSGAVFFFFKKHLVFHVVVISEKSGSELYVNLHFFLFLSGLRKPAKTLTRVELKKDPRRTIATIRRTLQSNNYRKDLINSAVRRTCAILKSQKPVVIKSKARAAKKD